MPAPSIEIETPVPWLITQLILMSTGRSLPPQFAVDGTVNERIVGFVFGVAVGRGVVLSVGWEVGADVAAAVGFSVGVTGPRDCAGVAAPGDPVPIGNGWQITPVAGWVATPHDKGAGVRLEKGVVVVDVFPEAYDNARDLARAYLEQALRVDATQITATDIETATSTTGSAARFTYQGLFPEADGAIEGEVTAIVVSARGVVADAWAAQGDLGGQIEEVHEMLATIAAAP